MIYMCDIKLDVIFIFSTADELGVADSFEIFLYISQ